MLKIFPSHQKFHPNFPSLIRMILFFMGWHSDCFNAPLMMSGELSLDETIRAIDLFSSGRDTFANYVSTIPPKCRVEFINSLINHQKNGSNVGLINDLLKQLAFHPAYSEYFNLFEPKCQQALFISNFPFLKTRVSLSFFDHPLIKMDSLNFTCLIFNNQGEKVYHAHHTIRQRETRSIEVSQIVPVDFMYGTMLIQSSDAALLSLRAYAYWYNNVSITTTHEKGAMLNAMPLIIAPLVVNDGKTETYMAISSFTERETKITCRLNDMSGNSFPDRINLRVPPRNAILIPLNRHLEGMETFLKGEIGNLYIDNDGPGCLYYYFIHNKSTRTWQVQHL